MGLELTLAALAAHLALGECYLELGERYFALEERSLASRARELVRSCRLGQMASVSLVPVVLEDTQARFDLRPTVLLLVGQPLETR